MPDSGGMIYQFEACTLDTRSRKLLRDGKEVLIQSQTYDLLQYLLEHPQRVISKDELLESVWTTTCLTDSTISQAVMKVRKAIGDDGRQQRLIRTHHGRGFELTSAVEKIAHASPSVSPGAPPAPSPQHPLDSPAVAADRRPERSPVRWGWLALLVALTGLVVVIMTWRSDKASDHNEPLATEEALPSAEPLIWFIDSLHNRTGDEAYDWVENGLSEAIASTLSRWPGVSVMEGDSYSDLKTDQPDDMLDILGADYRLGASIERVDQQFRLSYRIDQSGQSTPIEAVLTGPDLGLLTRALIDVCRDVVSQTNRQDTLDPNLFDEPLAAELYARARHAIHEGRHEDAARLLEAAEVQLPGNLDIRIAQIEARFRQDSTADAIEALETLQEEFGDQMSMRISAKLRHQLGLAYIFDGRIADSQRLLSEALSLSEQADDPVLKGRVLNTMAVSISYSGELEQARAYAMLALEQFTSLGDDYHRSQVLTNLAYLMDDFGRVVRSAELHREALVLREQYDFPELIAASRYGLGRILRRQGRFSESRPLLLAALETTRERHLDYDQFDNLQELAELELDIGQYAEAERWIAAATTLAEDSDDTFGKAWSIQLKGMLAMSRGHRSEAVEALSEAYRIFDELEDVQEADTLLFFLIQALLDDGQLEQAQQRIGSLRMSDDSEVISTVSIKAAMARAWVLQASGSVAEATARFEAAMSDANTAGAVDLEARIAIELMFLYLKQDALNKAELMLAIAKRFSRQYYRTVLADLAYCLHRSDQACVDHNRQLLSKAFPEVAVPY